MRETVFRRRSSAQRTITAKNPNAMATIAAIHEMTSTVVNQPLKAGGAVWIATMVATPVAWPTLLLMMRPQSTLVSPVTIRGAGTRRESRRR